MRPNLDTSDLRKHVEALVFVSETPLKSERIAEILELKNSVVLHLLAELSSGYDQSGSGLELIEVAEGFQLRTRPESVGFIQQLIKTRPFRFSRAALETLAIVAYRQPVTRAEVEYLRGVDSGGVFKTLLEKQLIRILGKKDVPGRPLIYGTTREFLEFFGLRDLSALPTLKEFSELSPASLEAQGSPLTLDKEKMPDLEPSTEQE
ncbi:MAG: SMC-Scp complex subunit ScpB [Desulfuromonadales bacterium]|nr:SMC-Scp complex subunit ScpB [Desulfuromonadales bacterium]